MKDYKKILEGVVNIISTTEESYTVSNICSYIVENCPELGIKAQDEVIRMWLVGYFNQYATDGIEKFGNGLEVKDVIAYLEKQGEQQTLYIRFGEIPDNEKSKIYCGEEEIGEEDGVSVYPAFEVNGNIVLGLTLPITKTTLYTQQHLLEYENRPCYLVKGDYIGKDADGQPLIHNVQIIKKIDNYRVKEEKVDNAEPKTEPTFLFKVNYNGKEYNVRRIFGAATFELYNESESNVYVDLPDCEIIRGGYGIKENGSPYPTKSATFSEQESVKVNKAEPKFQPGDWVVCEDDCSVHQIKGCFENLSNHTYDYELTEGGHISGDNVNKWHLWNFENDAKDGDVLISTVTNKPFIYNGSSNDTHVGAYCGINVLNTYKTAYPPYFWAEKENVRPATKEQRDFLFERMKEANYMWDFSNKKPVKIKTN
jgi:hypothetical protein